MVGSPDTEGAPVHGREVAVAERKKGSFQLNLRTLLVGGRAMDRQTFGAGRARHRGSRTGVPGVFKQKSEQAPSWLDAQVHLDVQCMQGERSQQQSCNSGVPKTNRQAPCVLEAQVHIDVQCMQGARLQQQSGCK